MSEQELRTILSMLPSLSSAISLGFKQLLEKKHLYQRYDVSFPDFSTVASGVQLDVPLPNGRLEECYNRARQIACSVEWEIGNPYGSWAGYAVHSSAPPTIPHSLRIEPQTIRAFCSGCGASEPFNFQHGTDVFSHFVDGSRRKGPPFRQVFVLGYECQACKSIPEIFLVQRDELRLSISGRSPMEKTKTPDCLPKGSRSYYSDALVAFNSGQVLAGNFLLRMFVEQFIRSTSSTPKSENIDTIFDDYYRTLPTDFKERFPSLRHIYDYLSIDMHGAHGSQEVFLQAQKEIIRHFEARRLYELS